MTNKYEILPPSRLGLPATRPNTGTVSVPSLRVDPGGIMSSSLTRWEANRHARTIGALATRTRAEADLFEAQTQAINSYAKRQEAGYRLLELPEVLANDRSRRRIERAEQLRQVQHQHEVAEMRRQTEVAQIETVLVDARQALKAQRDFGYTTYELAWKKKNCEMLDVELNAAERRAILRQHLGELDGSDSTAPASSLNADANDELIDDALHEKRAQLLASGLDTSRIDAVIERRKCR